MRILLLCLFLLQAGVLGAEQLDTQKSGAAAAVAPVQQPTLVTAVQTRDPGDPDPFIPLPEVRAAVQHVFKHAPQNTGLTVNDHSKPLNVAAKVPVSEVSSQAPRSESLVSGRPLRKLLGSYPLRAIA